jgi:hypothetical protein
MGMGSSKVDKSKASEMLHSFKPPIHRIAPNTIAKNDPVKKELFKVVLPTAAARMRPNLIGDFKKYARGYVFICYVDAKVIVTYGHQVGFTLSCRTEKVNW